MSEGTTETETEAAPEAAEETAPKPDAENELEEVDSKDAWDAKLALEKIRKLNAEVRSAKDRAKEVEGKATSANEEATTLRAQVAREKVARRLQLADNEDTDEFLGRLKGETVDDLMVDAERLLSLISASAKRPTTQRPTEALRGGLEPDKEPEETDTRKIAERMFRN